MQQQLFQILLSSSQNKPLAKFVQTGFFQSPQEFRIGSMTEQFHNQLNQKQMQMQRLKADMIRQAKKASTNISIPLFNTHKSNKNLHAATKINSSSKKSSFNHIYRGKFVSPMQNKLALHRETIENMLTENQDHSSQKSPPFSILSPPSGAKIRGQQMIFPANFAHYLSNQDYQIDIPQMRNSQPFQEDVDAINSKIQNLDCLFERSKNLEEEFIGSQSELEECMNKRSSQNKNQKLIGEIANEDEQNIGSINDTTIEDHFSNNALSIAAFRNINSDSKLQTHNFFSNTNQQKQYKRVDINNSLRMKSMNYQKSIRQITQSEDLYTIPSIQQSKAEWNVINNQQFIGGSSRNQIQQDLEFSQNSKSMQDKLLDDNKQVEDLQEPITSSIPPYEFQAFTTISDKSKSLLIQKQTDFQSDNPVVVGQSIGNSIHTFENYQLPNYTLSPKNGSLKEGLLQLPQQDTIQTHNTEQELQIDQGDDDIKQQNECQKASSSSGCESSGVNQIISQVQSVGRVLMLQHELDQVKSLQKQQQKQQVFDKVDQISNNQELYQQVALLKEIIQQRENQILSKAQLISQVDNLARNLQGQLIEHRQRASIESQEKQYHQSALKSILQYVSTDVQQEVALKIVEIVQNTKKKYQRKFDIGNLKSDSINFQAQRKINSRCHGIGRYLNQHLSLINSPNFNSMSFDLNSPAITANPLYSGDYQSAQKQYNTITSLRVTPFSSHNNFNQANNNNKNNNSNNLFSSSSKKVRNISQFSIQGAQSLLNQGIKYMTQNNACNSVNNNNTCNSINNNNNNNNADNNNTMMNQDSEYKTNHLHVPAINSDLIQQGYESNYESDNIKKYYTSQLIGLGQMLENQNQDQNLNDPYHQQIKEQDNFTVNQKSLFAPYNSNTYELQSPSTKLALQYCQGKNSNINTSSSYYSRYNPSIKPYSPVQFHNSLWRSQSQSSHKFIGGSPPSAIAFGQNNNKLRQSASLAGFYNSSNRKGIPHINNLQHHHHHCREISRFNLRNQSNLQNERTKSQISIGGGVIQNGSNTSANISNNNNNTLCQTFGSLANAVSGAQIFRCHSSSSPFVKNINSLQNTATYNQETYQRDQNLDSQIESSGIFWQRKAEALIRDKKDLLKQHRQTKSDLFEARKLNDALNSKLKNRQETQKLGDEFSSAQRKLFKNPRGYSQYPPPPVISN